MPGLLPFLHDPSSIVTSETALFSKRDGLDARKSASIYPVAKRMGNDRSLRTTAIESSSDNGGFPDDLPRSSDLFGVGLLELTRAHPERLLETDANVSAKRTASRN